MTLTEQWKKGELKEGWYYINDSQIDYKYSKHSSVDFFITPHEDIKEVLAPVPSYEEWQRTFHYAGKYEHEYTSCVMEYENLKQENQHLKELLKECRNCVTRQIYGSPTRQYFEGVFDDELLTKITNAIGEK